MNRIYLCFVVGSMCVACRSDGSLQGTLVGNPGNASLTAAPTAGTALRTARVAVDALVWVPCDGGAPDTTAISAELDLLVPSALSVPAGWWCDLEVVLSGPLVVEVDSDAGGAAAIELQAASVVVTSFGFAAGETEALLLELGHPDWLDPVELGFSGTQMVSIDAGSMEHDVLVARVEDGSGLFVDNGDQVLDATERVAGPVAEGPARPIDDDDDDDDDEE